MAAEANKVVPRFEPGSTSIRTQRMYQEDNDPYGLLNFEYWLV